MIKQYYYPNILIFNLLYLIINYQLSIINYQLSIINYIKPFQKPLNNALQSHPKLEILRGHH